ncbi:MAG: GntR family transcriptional regulator [Planctomycetes bacterium]|nr:GntR family transcriptional regulator [Planctomycetota bacterium]
MKYSVPAKDEFAAQMRERIGSGEFEVGSFLPPARVLSSNHGISQNTILRALKELEAEGILRSEPRQGYRVLARARDPQLGGPVAFILHQAGDPERWEPRHRIRLAYFQQLAAQRGWSVLAVPAADRGTQGVVAYLRRMGVCAAVIDAVRRPFLNAVKKLGLPIVMLDGWYEDLGVDEVVKDDFTGGYEAAQHLIQRGHRRIAWVGPLDTINAGERFGGAVAACVKAGLDIAPRDRYAGSAHTPETAIADFLDDPQRADAVLALWPSLSVDLANAIAARGLKIGVDLDAVGWSMDEELYDGYLARCPQMVDHGAVATWSVREGCSIALNRLDDLRRNPHQPPTRVRCRMQLRAGRMIHELPGPAGKAARERFDAAAAELAMLKGGPAAAVPVAPLKEAAPAKPVEKAKAPPPEPPPPSFRGPVWG